MNAILQANTPASWAVLRVWAADVRDTGGPAAKQAETLVKLLDNYYTHRNNERLAPSLWKTVMLQARTVLQALGAKLPDTDNTLSPISSVDLSGDTTTTGSEHGTPASGTVAQSSTRGASS